LTCTAGLRRAVSETVSKLRAGVMTTDPEHFGQRLRNGMLTWLTFRVCEGTRPGVAMLEHEPEVASAAVPPVSVKRVRAKAGRVRVRRK
jgi:hypothetical protein